VVVAVVAAVVVAVVAAAGVAAAGVVGVEPQSSAMDPHRLEAAAARAKAQR
jgi:hypothetical protein